MSSEKKRAKPTVTRIVDELRTRIVAGDLGPGQRMPSRAEIQRQFGVSPVTVQRGVDVLRAEGFVEVSGRRGTYVSRRPPHLYHYAMVFRGTPTAPGWPRLFQVLANLAAECDGSGSSPRRVTVHYGVEDHVDNPAYTALAAAVERSTLAGLIFPENPQATGLAWSGLGRTSGLPRVSFLGAPTTGCAAVRFGTLVPASLDALVEAGCRRIAVLGALRADSERITAEIERRGMATRPWWLHFVSLDSRSSARGIARLLFEANRADRPDGLFITDDNLTEYALSGIADAGVRVPDDLRVMTHCNFPWPVPSVLPVTRIGYDGYEVLETCLDLLSAQRQGAEPGVREVAPVFESEFLARRRLEAETPPGGRAAGRRWPLSGRSGGE